MNKLILLSFTLIVLLSMPTLAASHRPDYDGNGRSDILWNNLATGALTTWSGATTAIIPGTLNTVSPSLGWTIVGSGDFDGDGKTDILWYNIQTRATSIWSAGQAINVPGTGATADPNWIIVGVGDFNGDGKSDIFWRNTSTGANYIWSAGQNVSLPVGGPVSTTGGWQVVGVGDFDGDGKSDVLWYNTQTGQVVTWSDGQAVQVPNTGGTLALNSGWEIVGVGDFNGDGKSDILMYNATSGAISIASAGLLTSSLPVGPNVLPSTNWKIVGIGDFDGDGKSDILWYNTGTGQVVAWSAGQNVQDPGTGGTSPPSQGWTIAYRSFNLSPLYAATLTQTVPALAPAPPPVNGCAYMGTGWTSQNGVCIPPASTCAAGFNVGSNGCTSQSLCTIITRVVVPREYCPSSYFTGYGNVAEPTSGCSAININATNNYSCHLTTVHCDTAFHLSGTQCLPNAAAPTITSIVNTASSGGVATYTLTGTNFQPAATSHLTVTCYGGTLKTISQSATQYVFTYTEGQTAQSCSATVTNSANATYQSSNSVSFTVPGTSGGSPVVTSGVYVSTSSAGYLVSISGTNLAQAGQVNALFLNCGNGIFGYATVTSATATQVQGNFLVNVSHGALSCEAEVFVGSLQSNLTPYFPVP